jgi:hypothetical protein
MLMNVPVFLGEKKQKMSSANVKDEVKSNGGFENGKKIVGGWFDIANVWYKSGCCRGKRCHQGIDNGFAYCAGGVGGLHEGASRSEYIPFRWRFR